MKRFLALVLFSSALMAQSFETRLGTEAGDFFGGVQYRHPNGNTDPVYGGKVRFGLCQFASLFGEYSYSRIYSQTTYISEKQQDRLSLMDMGGGIELHYSGPRLQPYLLVGLGSLRNSEKIIAGSTHVTSSNYSFSYSLGGGARLFVTRGFGFFAEAKTTKALDYDRFERYAVGVFIQSRSPEY